MVWKSRIWKVNKSYRIQNINITNNSKDCSLRKNQKESVDFDTMSDSYLHKGAFVDSLSLIRQKTFRLLNPKEKTLVFWADDCSHPNGWRFSLNRYWAVWANEWITFVFSWTDREIFWMDNSSHSNGSRDFWNSEPSHSDGC